MLIKRASDIKSSEITPEKYYLDRRKFIGAGAAFATVAAAKAAVPWWSADNVAHAAERDDELTPYDDVTQHNNFYEFGTGKGDPAKNAHTLRPRPWSVRVEGAVNKPGDYDLDDLLKGITTEERIYRLR